MAPHAPFRLHFDADADHCSRDLITAALHSIEYTPTDEPDSSAALDELTELVADCPTDTVAAAGTYLQRLSDRSDLFYERLRDALDQLHLHGRGAVCDCSDDGYDRFLGAVAGHVSDLPNARWLIDVISYSALPRAQLSARPEDLDAEDTAELIGRLAPPSLAVPRPRTITVTWTGGVLITEHVSADRSTTVTHHEPLEGGYALGASLLSYDTDPPRSPAHTAMRYDPTVCQAGWDLYVAARTVSPGGPSCAQHGWTSGQQVLTALESAHRTLTAEQWHTVCRLADGWTCQLAMLLQTADDVLTPAR